MDGISVAAINCKLKLTLQLLRYEGIIAHAGALPQEKARVQTFHAGPLQEAPLLDTSFLNRPGISRGYPSTSARGRRGRRRTYQKDRGADPGFRVRRSVCVAPPGHNTPLPLERSPPASFKRSSESAKRKGAHGVVGPWRGPGDPEGRRPPPPTDSPLDGERSSRASSCAHGTRASVRRRWPPRVTGESRDYATAATA